MNISPDLRGSPRGALAWQHYWTRIDMAFENADGSWNLRFDHRPNDPATAIELRDFVQREGRSAPTGDAGSPRDEE